MNSNETVKSQIIAKRILSGRGSVSRLDSPEWYVVDKARKQVVVKSGHITFSEPIIGTMYGKPVTCRDLCGGEVAKDQLPDLFAVPIIPPGLGRALWRLVGIAIVAWVLITYLPKG